MASSSTPAMSLIIPTNNFVASLTMDSKYPLFHTFQKFLAASEVKHALTVCSDGISRAAVTAIYDSGEVDLVAHRIKFAYEGETKTITLATVREALQLPVLDTYDEPASLDTLKLWFEQIGCTENLEGKQGRLKKSTLRAEWSFFFDTISRVFSPKRTNFDVFPVYVQQMGYALLYNQKYDFAAYLLERIGECIHTDRKSIYYGRFLTAIFKCLFPNFVVSKPDNVKVPQLSARIMLEHFKQNCNKQLSDVVYPEHVLSLTGTRAEDLSGSQPLSIPSSQPLQTNIPSGSSQKLPVAKSGKTSKPTPKKRRRVEVAALQDEFENVRSRMEPVAMEAENQANLVEAENQARLSPSPTQAQTQAPEEAMSTDIDPRSDKDAAHSLPLIDESELVAIETLSKGFKSVENVAAAIPVDSLEKEATTTSVVGYQRKRKHVQEKDIEDLTIPTHHDEDPQGINHDPLVSNYFSYRIHNGCML